MVLIVTSDMLDAINRHAMTAYPDECCGVMAGRVDDDGKEAEVLWRLENQAPEEEADRRYVIEPEAWMQLEDKAAEQGRELVGIYHSHPDSPSEPSEFDRSHALPFLSYMIVSVVDGTSETVETWVLEPDRQSFFNEEVVVR